MVCAKASTGITNLQHMQAQWIGQEIRDYIPYPRTGQMQTPLPLFKKSLTDTWTKKASRRMQGKY